MSNGAQANGGKPITPDRRRKMEATARYFDKDGNLFENGTRRIELEKFNEMFPGEKAIRGGDAYGRLIGLMNGAYRPVARMVYYKHRPSLHKCSAKCRNGKCSGVCECQCGGKNHGIGS